MQFSKKLKDLCTGKDDCEICRYEARVKGNKNQPKKLTIINRDGSTKTVTPIKPWGAAK